MIAIYDLYLKVKDNSGLISIAVILLMSVLEVSKIPVHPWKWIRKLIQRLFLEEITTELKEIRKELKTLKDDHDKHIRDSEEKEAMDWRLTIMSFASAVASKQQFKKDQWDEVYNLTYKYEKFCVERNIENHVAEESIDYIRRRHASLLASNGFLKEDD